MSRAAFRPAASYTRLSPRAATKQAAPQKRLRADAYGYRRLAKGDAAVTQQLQTWHESWTIIKAAVPHPVHVA